MSSDKDPESERSRVGRARTWWHPLFARVLSWELAGAYEVRAEVLLGELPLRADCILVKLESGEVSPEALRDLREIVTRLRLRTIIELKSPTDGLAARDWEALSSYATLFLLQDPKSFYNHELSLIFVAPKLTSSFVDSLPFRELSLVEEEPGVHRIVGGMFDTWVIETDVVAGGHAHVLKLFSHFMLTDRRRIMQELTASGHEALFHYLAQQVKQIRKYLGEEMTIQDIQVLDDFIKEVRQTYIADATVKERLDGLTPEERLEGLSPEERLEGLSPEERERMKRILDQE